MKGFLRILKMLLMSAIIGILTALIVCIYKLCAHHIIHFSEKGFEFLRENLWIVPLILGILFLISVLLPKIYHRYTNLKGGGIPNAILSARGKINLLPISDTIGTFLMSLLTFLLGVPLGNEGPCVQMGAAMSGGISRLFSKDEEFKKCAVSAGACAGFSAAIGGGLSGVFFCFDEIERRPKFSLLFCTAVSSVICGAVSLLICPIFNIEFSLFGSLRLPEFQIKDIWVAAVVGIVFAVFSVVFLKFYKALRVLYNKVFCKISAQYKIFLVLAVCLFAGLVSFSFVSTGHALSSELLGASKPLLWLCVILLVRTFLTFSANANSLSGGTFIPLIAIGLVLASALATMLSGALGDEYYSLILMLAACASISSLMKMPLVAFVFAVEVFRCPQYVLFIAVSVVISYLLPALLKVNSINETVLEEKLPEISH